VSPGAGVKAGRRPPAAPAGLGLETGEDDAILHSREQVKIVPKPGAAQDRFKAAADQDRARRTQSVANLIRSPGVDDPREPERWNPGLKLIKEILLTREPEVAEFPLVLRLFTRLAAHSTAWSRRGAKVLHYRF
jgi:hypothetical protein